MASHDLFLEQDQARIGLYVSLVEGGELDLRVAANAALAFDSFIRKFVDALEPGAEIEISLVRGDQGSLNLISNLKAKVSNKTLRALALLAAGWIGGEVLSFGFQEFLTYLRDNLTEDQVIEIGEENLRRMAEACIRAAEKPELANAHQELTSTLSLDADVTGVGMTIEEDKRPKFIMHRRNFPDVAQRLFSLGESDVSGDKREVIQTRELILTEPVLIDRPRKWRFLMGRQEISASILDEAFRQRALQGKLGVQLSQGIQVNARVRILEERVADDLWKPTRYDVIEVLSWEANPSQSPLAFLEPEDE